MFTEIQLFEVLEADCECCFSVAFENQNFVHLYANCNVLDLDLFDEDVYFLEKRSLKPCLFCAVWKIFDSSLFFVKAQNFSAYSYFQKCLFFQKLHVVMVY